MAKELSGIFYVFHVNLPEPFDIWFFFEKGIFCVFQGDYGESFRVG